MYELVDFSECPMSDRHGSYSGNAGGKRGVVYKASNWIVKYPKTTRSMAGTKLPSYTSSPLSEFLGSRVYGLLGIDVHETVLGFDQDKVVVGCKDFRPDNAILKEFRSIKNAMTPELNDRFDREVAESATGDRVSLEETFFHLENNPLCEVAGIWERFADMMIVDAIIDNNDRNNGHWGFLSVGGVNSLAPVFDNGNAFSNKVDDNHLDVDGQVILSKWLGERSIYEMDGHQLSNKNLFAADIPGLEKAACRIVPLMAEKMDEVERLVCSLPVEHAGKPVCSELRKASYLAGMRARLQWLADDFEIDIS